MNDCPQPDCQPECCDERPDIGFTAVREFVSCYPITPRQVGGPDKICSKGRGVGVSTLSQADADQDALEKAKAEAAKRLGLKLNAPPNPFEHFGELDEAFKMIAPVGAGGHFGKQAKKPWDYRVTAAIPHLETITPLRVCIEVLRHQSERPYIMVIDTGSSPKTRAELERLRAEDVEIHYIAGHAYRHSSEPVTAALDVAQSLCRTDAMFHTHSDCFLRRFDFIDSLYRICNEKAPVIGYRMSPRDWVTNEWEWMVGHTALMLHMPTIHEAGATWSFQRMHTQFGYDYENKGGWPDTETGFNHALKRAGIKPVFIGYDINFKRQKDDNIDHVRSYAGGKIYGSDIEKKQNRWMRTAMNEAIGRLAGKVALEELSLVNEN